MPVCRAVVMPRMTIHPTRAIVMPRMTIHPTRAIVMPRMTIHPTRAIGIGIGVVGMGPGMRR